MLVLPVAVAGSETDFHTISLFCKIPSYSQGRKCVTYLLILENTLEKHLDTNVKLDSANFLKNE